MMPLQPDTSLSLGQQLASQRKVRGLSTMDISLQLKIAESIIQALEADDWTRTGISEQFMRGYARNYMQLLGIEMTSQLVESVSTSATSLSSVNQLERPMKYVPVTQTNHRWSWLWLTIILVIVLVALWSQPSLLDELGLASWFNHENK
jgi:cytoskeletal protein RodZ